MTVQGGATGRAVANNPDHMPRKQTASRAATLSVAGVGGGEELRARRLEAGLSLRKLSALTGISYSFLSQVERGRRSPSAVTYESMRSALGLAPASAAAPEPAAADETEKLVQRVARTLLAGGDTSLTALAEHVRASTARVRIALPSAARRLAGVGVGVTADGEAIRVLAGGDVATDRPSTAAGRGAARRRSGSQVLAPFAAPSELRLTSPVLVGRAAELATLVRAATEPPAVIVVEGEAGIGKSRLVAELLQQPALQGVRRLLGRCHSVREPFPLGPVLDALRDLDDLPDARVFSPVVGALRPLLPELGDHLPAALEPLSDFRAERHLVFRAIRALLGRLGPTLLVVEDLQDADEGTAELLRFLAADLPPCVCIVVTRRDEAHPVPDEDHLTGQLGPWTPAATLRLAPRTATATLRLAPLTVEEVRRLIAAILDTDGVSEELAAQLHERTAGIPFALEEVIRTLREDRALVTTGGSWVRRSLDQLEVPRPIRDSLLARIAPLGPDARRIAESAAVLGVPATERALTAIAALSTVRGLRGLRSCLEAAVLLPSADGLVGFRHALASQALYETIAGDKRRALHLRAARVLEQAEPRPVAQLAHHYRLAAQTRPWQRYAEEAAAQASAHGDHVEAARLLAGVVSEPTLQAMDRYRIAVKLSGAALLGHAYQEEALAALRGVVELPRIAAGSRGHARSRLGLLLVELGDASEGHRELARSVTELRRRPATAALAMVNLALPMVIEGDEDTHKRWLAQAAEAAARQSEPFVSLVVETGSALVGAYFGDPGCWDLTEHLMGRRQQGDEDRQLLWLSAHLVGACYHTGHDERARSFLADADSYAERLGWGRLRPMRDTAVLTLDWASADWFGLEARALALADSIARDYPASTAIGRTVAGALALARGDLDAAERRLRASCEAAPGTGLIAWLAVAFGGLARVHLERGDAAEAVSAAAYAVGVLAAKNMWGWAADCVPAGVEALLAGHRADEARALSARFAAGLRDRDAPAAAAALQLCEGLLVDGDGDLPRAAAAYAAAAEAYAALPRPYDAARAALRQGLCLLADRSSDGADIVLEALACFESIGALGDVGRARRALRQYGVPIARRGGRRAYGVTLSPRETDVVELAERGRSIAEIAEYLAIARRTVEHHLTAARRKLNQAPEPESMTRALRVHSPANIARVRH